MENNLATRLLAVCLRIGKTQNAAEELFGNILKGLAVRLDYWSPNKFRNNSYLNKYKVKRKLESGNFDIAEWNIISDALKTPIDVIFRGGELEEENIRNFATLYYLEPINMTA